MGSRALPADPLGNLQRTPYHLGIRERKDGTVKGERERRGRRGGPHLRL